MTSKPRRRTRWLIRSTGWWRAGLTVASLSASLPASACGYLYFGSHETIIGRTVIITYDRILDAACGGAFESPTALVTIPPKQGQVFFERGKFRYVAVKTASGTDRFAATGVHRGKPYKLTVNVTFK